MKVSYKNIKRYKEILHILIKYGFSFAVEKLNMEQVAYRIPMTKPSEEIINMTTGERIRKAFEELGPTYVKLGQILSTRSDIFDQDVIDELSKLRDNVEMFSTDIAKEIFISDTGLKIEDVFKEFNYTPIAAASIGQAYEGKLYSGEEVIVKIQRPNIEQTIKSDLEILQSGASILNDIVKDNETNFEKILEEFKIQLLRELDYNFEAINAIKFYDIFKDSDEVYIPKIYSEYTTKRVLVMEKIIGIKLSDISTIKSFGWDTKKISDIGVRSLFKQVFEYGFFHADPHPGNIFVLGNNCISYIDFGMIGLIDKKTLNSLNSIVLAVVNRNVDKILFLFEEMGIIKSAVDKDSIRLDLLYLLHYYYDIPLEKISLSEILNEVFRFFRKYNISMPSEFSILAKTVITLEGTARELNPNFTVEVIGKEFISYYYKHILNPKEILSSSKNIMEEAYMDLKHIPKQLRVILKNIERNNTKIHIDDIKAPKLEEQLNDLTTNISLSLVLASLVVGSSLIIASPNIEQNIWVRYLAIAGFIVSFIVGLTLVITLFKTKYKRK
ncbi:ABC1 kinase family protein [Romboutsia sp. 1001713B170207_170306_H8]|uniref:ABC1 kinase family protein n=1 Tax=Romboutsia sp. 1001713B170207_170306_H8 TaxID=2787112 RepID=UPI0008209D6D|nr:AarF/ABC1/UbiB kinase family protein [Romboutsia sp. 1001713B170207_170306_H8]SCI03817.1 Probable ubiquinone biosynthesis protein UbiB [uncultured Clostridium sp.]